MKKNILLLFTGLLLFSCSKSEDDLNKEDLNDIVNNDATTELPSFLFAEEISGDNKVSITTDGETRSYNKYDLINDDTTNSKILTFYNETDNDESGLSISVWYEDGKPDWILITFYTDKNVTSEYYKYNNKNLDDDNPQDIVLEIDDESDIDFKASFTGILSNRTDGDAYTTLQVSNAVIDITF